MNFGFCKIISRMFSAYVLYLALEISISRVCNFTSCSINILNIDILINLLNSDTVFKIWSKYALLNFEVLSLDSIHLSIEGTILFMFKYLMKLG
jgi:hypothetical protein